MEPITTTALGITLWEYLGKPIVDKVKDKYSEKMLDSALTVLKIKDDDKKVIEAEIVSCDERTLADKNKFLNFINNNQNIEKLIKQDYYQKQENHINITIEGDVQGVINANSGAVINQTFNNNAK